MLLSHAANTDMIDYNKYEIDANVNDMMWCGNQNEVILVLTQRGTVYRSRDRGSSWKKLQSVMAQAGSQVADPEQEVSDIRLYLRFPVGITVVYHIFLPCVDWNDHLINAEPRRRQPGGIHW